MYSVYSFVIDGDPKFFQQSRVLLTSLSYVGVLPAQVIAHFTPSASEETKKLVSTFGVELRPIDPFLDEKYCNKLSQLGSLMDRHADIYVLCDTDLAFMDSIEPLFDLARVRAKHVDLPNPPLYVLDEVAALFGISNPPRIVQTSCEKAPTYSVNCNGGLYIIPSQLARALFAKWTDFAQRLRGLEPLLGTSFRHIDQISFAMAMLSLGLDVSEIPIEYNFPIHLVGQLKEMAFGKPRVLHYHWLQHENGALTLSGHSLVDLVIGEANAILVNK
jgi:hypothetical protein